MKIIAWACICPNCRTAYTAYLADVADPPHDEIAHDKRSVLCVVCERDFINRFYHAFKRGHYEHGGLPTCPVCVSEVQQDAHLAGEPRHEAEVGTDPPHDVPSRVHGVPHRDRNASMEDRVSGPLGEATETVRGQAALPAEQPE